ncbi:ABC transporter ATP-binding protein [Roseomonas sp. 18066]|uniref:ABC transporter ATP-binding protein n=1 Tax=Roseomonas sp. 18066 TaxID=2681412 RepID=UPI0013581DD9|nr:ABC transporter ATP-binding protein [Roseomonas sp. 18066]
MNEIRLRLENVQRRFRTEAGELPVLTGAELTIAAGEIVALVAPSGTGKSTLLHLAGLLERPDSGEVHVGGKPTVGLKDDARSALRGQAIGFVYQFHHLLPEFTALENIVLPQMAIGVAEKPAADRARELLARFGLSSREGHRPGRLSGGEQQRVAIARALANKPGLLLADEPTGNLDVATSDKVFSELLEAVRGAGVGALIATHNPELARRMDRVVTLKDGRVVDA